MPMLQQETQIPAERKTFRLRKDLIDQITAYSNMISSSEEYVVSEVLTRFFSKDKDFQEYIQSHSSEFRDYEAVQKKKRGRPNKSVIAA